MGTRFSGSTGIYRVVPVEKLEFLPVKPENGVLIP